MKKRPKQDALSELRKRAEAKQANEEQALLDASPEEMTKLVHELHTHQIELELQNEELRRAQAELVGSRDQYTRLYDFAPVGYATVSGKGIIEQANQRLSGMLGVPRAQLVGRPLSAFVAAEDADRFHRHWRGMSRSEPPSAYELRMKGPDDTIFWAAMQCVADQSAPEADAVFRCSMCDITDRKQTETQLLGSREELAEIFTMSLDLICIADINEATFLKVNPAFTRVLGYDGTELVNHPFSEFIHPDDIEPTRKVVEDELGKGKVVMGFTNRYRRKDGTWCWLEWTAHPLVERGITFSVAHDVTERKRVQEELKRERDFAETLVETAQTIVLVLDTEGRIVRFNPYMEQLTGYRLDEVKGKDWFSTFLPGNDHAKIREVFQQAVHDIQTHGNVNAILTKDGREREIEWYDHVLRDVQGEVVGVLAVGQDVTERKQAEEELRTSEARNKAVLAAVPDLMFGFSREGEILYYNAPDVNDLYGRPEDFIGKSIDGILPGDVGAKYRSIIQRTLETGKIQQFEYQLPVPKGVQDFESRMVVSGPNEVLAIVRNITERKRGEEKLRASEERFRGLVENVSLGITLIDREHAIVMANPTISDLLGRPTSELIGRKCYREFEKREAVCPHCPGVMAMATGAGAEVETEAVLEDGSRLPVRVSAFPLRDADGSIGGFIEVIEDITERKQAEEQLLQERDTAQTYLDVAGVMMVALNAKGEIVLCNKKGCGILGYEESEIIGRNWFSTCLPSNITGEVRGVFAQLMAGQVEPVEFFENPVVTASGEHRNIAFHNAVLRDKSSKITGILFSGEDITERKRLEERLRQTEKMEAIGQLAGGVAHDFNNQLAGIMNYADLLLAKTKDEELHRYIAAIIRSCTRGKDLTGQLLAFSRKGKYQVVPVNMHHTITEVVGILEHSIDKRIAIRQLLEASPATTTGDPSQLQNVLLNLGLNARDAMPDGGELVFTTGTVTLDEAYCGKSRFNIMPGDYLRITVTDSGTGMDKEIRAKAFEPFFTTKEQGKGTGMGLASVYGTVVNHQGAIEVDSEIGQGTTVTVYLPLSRQEAEEAVKAGDTSPEMKGGARILMVDDEKSVRESTAALLRGRGYKVVTAKDGGEAVEYYAKSWEHIDLVILDMNMPVMNGRDTFVAMRKISPDIKAILATGYSLDSNAQEILDEGALSHIQKPFHVDDLVPQIEQALSG